MLRAARGGPTFGMNLGLMKKPVKPPGDPGEARIDRVAIGDRLRELFDEVVNEPVPDDFLELLRRADEREGPGEGASDRGNE
jgi:Anti-sigma factor NepR